MRLRDRVGLTDRHQRLASRAMQVAMVGLMLVGLYERSAGIAVNTGVALAVAKLPALLERDYGIELDAGLSLWLTTAVFLHAWGTVGIPGVGESFYRSLWWWDHLTHALSSSVVAGAGYTTVRAFDRHSDGISLPPRFTFVFVLLFVLAFGVVWEVIEFAVGSLGVLSQYGLSDTMLDLVFDAVGGLVVATWGQAHLTDVVGQLQRRLEVRGAD